MYSSSPIRRKGRSPARSQLLPGFTTAVVYDQQGFRLPRFRKGSCAENRTSAALLDLNPCGVTEVIVADCLVALRRSALWSTPLPPPPRGGETGCELREMKTADHLRRVPDVRLWLRSQGSGFKTRAKVANRSPPYLDWTGNPKPMSFEETSR